MEPSDEAKHYARKMLMLFIGVVVAAFAAGIFTCLLVQKFY